MAVPWRFASQFFHGSSINPNPLSLFLSISRVKMIPQMISDDSESDSPGKCRERRRRRIEKRRLKSGVLRLLGPPQSPNREESGSDNSDPFGDKKLMSCSEEVGGSGESPLALEPRALGSNPMPVYGSILIPGQPGGAGDTVMVKPDFCRTGILDRQPLHFFAVCDGHGGPHVSALCRDLLHLFIEQELNQLMHLGGNTVNTAATVHSGGGGGGGGDNCIGGMLGQEEEKLNTCVEDAGWEEKLRGAMKGSFHRMDQLVLSTCTCGKVGYECGCQPMDLAFAGSTVVMAIVAPSHLLVANCGDSHALLCRAGQPLPLSTVHKLDRPEEQASIQVASGKVVYRDGVQASGLLNLSRSLGDNFLKSIVASEPEIYITKRDPSDECLILASNGLWDVLSEDMACNVACTCLQEGSAATAPRNRHYSGSSYSIDEQQAEVLFPSQSALAVALLGRLALARGSCDDISIIVVDLKRH
ncbi:probable protein phosphatase 2C 75 isoform X2 [Malania oleifera]|uniref:probable protein phosphatase 2C 75 isoform X2 n=1 Tax=Malania oleifera TaxID=397392 RepID=UPI0025ADEFA6|nr:probable protein phosphatase 2C 75 isoform X2 [Malania oleifera]